MSRTVVYPPHVPAEVWDRFVAKVYSLPRSHGSHHLWTSPPRTDGYGQFWVPRYLEDVLGQPDDDPADMPGALPLPGLPAPADSAGSAPVLGRPWRAHRVAWAAWYGPLDRSEVIMHRCDQPLCVPITREAVDRHLVLGDLVTNAADRDRKNRGARRSRDGMLWGNADRRGPANRSLAIHQALTAALAQHATPAQVAAAVTIADRAGAPFPGQLALARRPARRRPQPEIPTESATVTDPLFDLDALNNTDAGRLDAAGE